jgi:F-type H+-transporting ATPase subunit b
VKSLADDKASHDSRAPRPLICGLVLLVVAVAFPAHASGEESGGGMAALLWQAANLALLLGVVFAAARKPVTAYFAERREQIRTDIQTADKLLADSKEQFMAWQKKLSELEQAIASIREETRERAEDERDKIIAAAHDRANRIKEDAVSAIDQELRGARVALREEAANIAVDLAATMLDQQVDDRDRDRLLDEFITHVEPNGAADGNGR